MPCDCTSILHTFQRDAPDWESDTLTGYQKSAQTMLKMMWTQATGLPSGNHGLFHRYHIEAVTLEGVRKKKSGRVSLDEICRYN